MMIKIKMIKENRSMMIKIKMIKEIRGTTTMIMSKMIKGNRSMTVKEASRDLSEPGMQRRSSTMWWRKRDGSIIRIFFGITKKKTTKKRLGQLQFTQFFNRYGI